MPLKRTVGMVPIQTNEPVGTGKSNTVDLEETPLNPRTVGLGPHPADVSPLGSDKGDQVIIDKVMHLKDVRIEGSLEQTEQTKFAELQSDPTPEPNVGQLYAKDSLGTTQLFYEDDSGNITQLGGGPSTDPWSVPLPGTYAPGEAGDILGNMNPAVAGDAMTLTAAYDASKFPTKTTVVTDFTFLNNTNEQDAYIYDNTDGKSKRFSGSMDNDALVTAASVLTVRVYEKIDGTNYREIDEKLITVGTQPESFSFEYESDQDFKLTYQINVADGANRVIKRNIRIWALE